MQYMKILLDCFHRGLETENRRIDEHLFKGEMVNQPYMVVSTLLDKGLETNKESQKQYAKVTTPFHSSNKNLMSMTRY